MRPVTVPPAHADAREAAARRGRALAGVGAARLENAWLRLGASGLAAVVATSIVGNAWPLIWAFGLAAVVFIDRTLYGALLKKCEAGAPPARINGLILWTATQSLYGNVLAALLWFAPYVPGETLSIIFICGGLANAAASLRSVPSLAMAGAAPTIAFLLGLPLADYILDGARNPLYLLPMVGGLLLLGFGVNLWRSLLALDTAQAQAEAAAVRERQAAAAAAAAKTDMIRRMNDELRTPMTALISAAEHLRRAAATPQARAHIATLVQAGEVLKLVLDDLSDLDRLENGQLPIEPKRASPREIVRSVASAFRAAAQDKQIELFVDVTPDVPAAVEIDALRVRQVLFNLCANAVRYTTHGGVRMRLSAQALEAGRMRLTFIVADTGAGMTRAQLAKVMSRGRMCGDGEGPGLGLAISLRLARLMGGLISARSEPEQGSVFSFALDAPLLAQSGAQSAA